MDHLIDLKMEEPNFHLHLFCQKLCIPVKLDIIFKVLLSVHVSQMARGLDMTQCALLVSKAQVISIVSMQALPFVKKYAFLC